MPAPCGTEGRVTAPLQTDHMPAGGTLLIANPVSGQAAAARSRERLPWLLAEAGLPPTVHITSGPGDATQAARDAVVAGFERVVVAGGDGTTNEVVQGLAGSHTPLGLVPLGTGNVLARQLGLGVDDPEGACRVIAANKQRPVDLGAANGRHFVLMAGAGIDGEVAAQVQGFWKDRLGMWAFVGEFAAQALAHSEQHMFRVVVDGQALERRMWSVLVCNAAQYAWRLSFAPAAQMDDGLLHVVMFHHPGRFQLLSSVVGEWLRGGGTEIPHVTQFRGRQVEVHADPPAKWQADGETGGTTPVRLEVAHLALTLIVP